MGVEKKGNYNTQAGGYRFIIGATQTLGLRWLFEVGDSSSRDEVPVSVLRDLVTSSTKLANVEIPRLASTGFSYWAAVNRRQYYEGTAGDCHVQERCG